MLRPVTATRFCILLQTAPCLDENGPRAPSLAPLACPISTRAGLEALCNPRTAALLAVGLALLLVFSRLFGSKAFWKTAGLYQASRAIKTAAEESLELLAYSFLCLWCILTLRALPPRPAS